MKELEEGYEFTKAYIKFKQIRQRVAELESDNGYLHTEIDDCHKKLAAAQLENKRLRSALAYVIDDLELRASLKWDEDERGVVDIGNGAYTQAKEALREPTDTEALEKYVKERLGEPVGYWQTQFSKYGGATLYEVPQVSVFGISYRNEPLYALKEPK